MSKVTLYLGPPGSGKTHKLLGRYAEVLSQRASSPRARTLWLAPSSVGALDVRRALVSAGPIASLSPGVFTFEQFSATVLAGTPLRVHLLSRAQHRDLLRQTVLEAVRSGVLQSLAQASAHGGFIDLLCEHVNELHRRGLSGASYARFAKARAGAPHLREIAQLVTSYERQLQTHALVDPESVSWIARDALGADRMLWGDLELVVVDGFTDFTRPQHEILKLLAARSKQLMISLPYEDERLATRADLFAKITATRARLRQYQGDVEEVRVGARSTGWEAMDLATAHLFRRADEVADVRERVDCHLATASPERPALARREKVTIVEAASAHDEIVEIARRIKRLLQGDAGCRPARAQDILVVFRSLSDVAPRVREVFEEFGLPYSMVASPPLRSAPIVRTLVGLIQLHQEDWPFRQVVAVVTNRLITSIAPAARRGADWLVRDLQMHRGRERLLARVRQLASQEASGEMSPHARTRVVRALQARGALGNLAGALDELPREATPREWSVALLRLCQRLGIEWDKDNESDIDNGAWQAIEAHFGELERLDAWLGHGARVWTCAEMHGALVEFTGKQSLAARYERAGRVQVLAGPSARSLRAKHVFLGGMSEQAFPALEPAGRLATDADYRQLEGGASAERKTSASTRSEEEMLLFYELISRAEQSLTISYPALDERAQSLPPSPYVVELERLLGGDLIDHEKPQLSPLPRGDRPGRMRDLRSKAVWDALHEEGGGRLLAGMLASDHTRQVARSIAAAIEAHHVRTQREFGSQDGLVLGDGAVEKLSRRFGAQHVWSPSQWESYASCPFRFFIENVLGIAPLGDLVLETDFARRGSRLHQVLAAFHRQWCADSADPEASSLFVAELERAIGEQVRASESSGIDAALLELDKRQIEKWCAKHFDNHQKYDAACRKLGSQMQARHFEFRFGAVRAGSDGDDPSSVDAEFTLNLDGEAIRVSGQIDRIDVAEVDGHVVFNVIDYKSGRRPALSMENIESGERLQLPIYVEAAQAMLFHGEATPWMAGYWSMASGFDSRGVLSAAVDDREAHWEQVRASVRARIRQFIDSIRRGEFPVASRNAKCTSECDFATVCRVSLVRSLGKTWPPEPK